MKNYEKPVLEITVLSNEDVITASGGLNLYKTGKLVKGENTIEF